MNQLTKFKLIFIFLLASQVMVGQGHMNKAWDYFTENNLSEAKRYFKKASTSPKDASDAFIAMSLIDEIISPAESFTDFQQSFDNLKDPNPYLYAMWYEGSVTSGKGYLSKTKLKWLKTIMESGKLNPIMKAKVNSSMGYHYEAINKYKKADAEFSKLGAIMRWQLAGHFENVSGSGFNKDYKPLFEPSNAEEFTNRYGATVKWFSLPYNYKPGRWIYPSNHVYTSEAIVYAQTFIRSNKDQEVHLRIGACGSIKVLVNDQLLFSEEEERETDIDTYIIVAKLKKGYNRIVLQLGESGEIDNIKYIVRITDKQGNLLEGIEAYDKPKSYKKETSFEPEVVPNFAEAYFEKQLSKDSENMLYTIMLAKAYLLNGKSYQTRKLILKAQEKAETCSYLSNILMDVYKAEDSETLLSRELEKVKKNDPENPQSLQLLFDDALEKEDYEEAHDIIEALEDVVGNSADVKIMRILTYINEEETDKAVAIIKQGFIEHPDNYVIFYYHKLVQLSLYNNQSGAIRTIKTYMKHNYSLVLHAEMANLYGQIGNPAKMFKIYEELLEKKPYTNYFRTQLADYYFLRQGYYRAIDYYEEIAKVAPYKSDVYVGLAKCYKELDEEDDAIENFEMALHLNPNHYEARDMYRKFLGKKAVFDYFDDPDFYEICEKAPTKDDYPEDNSVYLWRETQRAVYINGGSEERHLILVKILNSSGIDDWKEINLGESTETINIEKAEVIKSDGSIVKAEVEETYIVFKDLNEGDAISIIYKKQRYSWGKLMKHFTDVEYFFIGYPYEMKKYSLLVEGDKKFTWKVANSDMKPDITSPDSDFKMYVWKREKGPSLKDESYIPAIDDFTEVLHISSYPDWQFINDWYYDISTPKAKADFEVKEVVSQLLKGKENLSDLEKAKILYRYVVEEIRYSSISFRQSGIVPQKASKVINTKIGDCKDVSTLFIAMCREIGLKADIVLVNTRDNGETELALPGTGFNHAIAKVVIDGNDYFIELTSDLIPFGTAGTNLKKAFVLEITDKKEGSTPMLLDFEKRVPNKYIRGAKIRFEDDKMIIERDAIRYGTYAASTRGFYRDIGDEKRMKGFQEAVSDDFVKAKVLDFKFDSTLYLPTDSIVFSYSFEVLNPFNKLGNIQLLKLPFAWKQEPLDFLNSHNREYPVAFWKYSSADYKTETIEITIPTGKRLYEKPKNHRYTSKWGTYTLTFKQVGKVLYVTRTMEFTGVDVIGVDEFEAFSDFYGKIIKADETQIGFK